MTDDEARELLNSVCRARVGVALLRLGKPRAYLLWIGLCVRLQLARIVPERLP